VDFAFNFQIAGDKKRMLSRFERFNIVGKEVIIIPRIDADSSKKQRLVDGRAVVLDSECGSGELHEN
jgi:hypothetical protein